MRLLALLAVVPAALAASASARLMTAPAKDGRIAFVRFGLGTEAEESQIFVVNPDGSGERMLIQPPVGYRDELPDWRRDGSRIMFQRCASGGGACGVFSVKPDGRGLTRLTAAPCPTARTSRACVDDRSAVYSPDGRRIAFVRTSKAPLLMVADAKLRHARRVVGGGPYAVAWSPNGKQLAFASVNGTGRAVYVVNANGTGIRRLTPWTLEAGGRPDWSPDGKRILFRSNSNRLGGFGVNLYTVRRDGTGLTQLTHVGGSNRVLDGSYSPSGRSIVFSTTAGATQAQPDIFVIRTNGTGPRPVTRSVNWDGSPDWGPRR